MSASLTRKSLRGKGFISLLIVLIVFTQNVLIETLNKLF